MSPQNGSAGGSKESTPVSNGTNGTSNGSSLTYEEELCLKLEDEARLQKFCLWLKEYVVTVLCAG